MIALSLLSTLRVRRSVLTVATVIVAPKFGWLNTNLYPISKP